MRKTTDKTMYCDKTFRRLPVPSRIIKITLGNNSEADEIEFLSINGEIFIMFIEMLIPQINDFMKASGNIQKHRYFTFNGENGYEFSLLPRHDDVLSFISSGLCNFQIYDSEGGYVE